MPFGAIIGAGIGLLGSSMQADAASSAAQANVEAAKIAAEAQKFRPVGVTTRFGTSNFKFGIPGVAAPKQSDYATPEEYQQALSAYQTRVAKEGYLTEAGYTLSPEVAAIRDRLLSQAGTTGLNTAEQAQAAQQGLFNLGQQYLAQSPEAAAQQWMSAQQAALAPSNEKALSGIRQNLFNTGRGGLAVAQGGDMGAANPELQAYYNALAKQNLDLASKAQQQGRAQTQFGAGLFGTGLDIASAGYNPLKTQFGLGQTMEEAGQNALNLGIKLGGYTTDAASNAANTLYKAQTGLNQANATSPWGDTLLNAAGNRQLTSGIGNWMSGLGAAGNPNYVVDTSGLGLGWGNTNTADLPAGWRN